MANAVWPYIPLPECEEVLSWMTVTHARQKDNVRYGLRPARQRIVYGHAFSQPDWLDAEQYFRDNIDNTWAVPVWFEASDVSVTISDTTITCDTDAEFGTYGLIWSDCDTYELVTITAVNDGSVTISPGATATYANAKFMPVRLCISRAGLQTERPNAHTQRCSIEFEATDYVDRTLVTEQLQMMIAFHIGSPLATDEDERLATGKANVHAILQSLQDSGLLHDVRIVGSVSSAVSALERTDCDATDYDDLHAFVDTLELSTLLFEDQITGAGAFYSGSRRRVLGWITDKQAIANAAGEADVVAAIAARDAIADLEAFAVSIQEHDNYAELNRLDNTSTGYDQAQTGDMGAYFAIIGGVLGVTTYGAPLIPCSGGVISPIGGSINKIKTYVDSGFGPVSVETHREKIDDAQGVTLGGDTLAKKRAIKDALHVIRGRWGDFWYTESVHPILESTATQVKVANFLNDFADWPGLVTEIDGYPRPIRGATIGTVGGVGVDVLNIDELPSAPSGPLRLLRRGRHASDEVRLRHNWKGGWFRSDIGVQSAEPTRVGS